MELIPTLKIETSHPVGVLFGSELTPLPCNKNFEIFSHMCNIFGKIDENTRNTNIDELSRGTRRRNVKRRCGRVNSGITLCGAFESDEITRGSR